MKFLIPYVMAITQNPHVLHALVTDYCNIFVPIDNYVSCFILRHFFIMYANINYYLCIIITVPCIHAHNYVLIPYILMKFFNPLCNGNNPKPLCTTCTSN